VLKAGGVLVRTAFSLISAGTERSTVETARNSLVGKAISRPDLVRQVLETVKREGLGPTYRKVRSQLNQVKALGYSTSGIVVGVGKGAEEFRAGDRIACAGAGFASHAETNFVPANLCARVPGAVSLEAACYTTVGAIALHGLRQSEARVGEVAAVIGLGLVGQLTVQLLKAAGCQVIGFDPDQSACRLARISGADRASLSVKEMVETCRALTMGRGADCILITAGTKSNQPVELAADLARDRARVVVVGLVGMDVPRHLYYAKEIELRVSRSYGPGRYDQQYEEGGIDYPIGYVRWTEKRNMEAFLSLAAQGKVNPVALTTHRFGIDQANEAYDVITGRETHAGIPEAQGRPPLKTSEAEDRGMDCSGEPERLDRDSELDSGSHNASHRCGVVLVYPDTGAASESRVVNRAVKKAVGGEIGIGFVGAGNFARGVLLPIVARTRNGRLTGVASATGLSGKNTAEQFGFQYSTSDYGEILDDPATDCVFVATRHDAHAGIAAECLKRGKSVFVEKPLAITADGLRQVLESARASAGHLFVGYNRRFSPLALEAKKKLDGRAGAVSVIYRVNAGRLPAEHWSHDPDQGGGRIIGEVCHFIDFVQFLTDASPVRVSAEAVASAGSGGFVDDSCAISLRMADGSIASIVYYASGDQGLGKERIEIYCGGSVAIIDDFRAGEYVRAGKSAKLGSGRQDKGHAWEISAFLDAVSGKSGSPFTLESLAATTLATFAINESLRASESMVIDTHAYLSQFES
jgi:polar amino acid transport system substrate-binding protein